MGPFGVGFEVFGRFSCVYLLLCHRFFGDLLLCHILQEFLLLCHLTGRGEAASQQRASAPALLEVESGLGSLGFGCVCGVMGSLENFSLPHVFAHTKGRGKLRSENSLVHKNTVFGNPTAKYRSFGPDAQKTIRYSTKAYSK